MARLLALSLVAGAAWAQSRCNNSMIDIEFVIDDSLSLSPQQVSGARARAAVR